MNAFDFPARPIALIAGSLLLVFLLVRAYVVRKSESPVLTLLVCALLAGVLAWQAQAESRWQHIQAEATRVVSLLAAGSAEVHCQRVTETYLATSTTHGTIGLPEDTTTLGMVYVAYQTCADLGTWLDTPGSDPTLAQIAAVHDLTHQTAHLLGATKEAFAECEGMRMDVRAAEAFGATPLQALRLARDYRQEIHPTQPDDYHSSACTVF